MKINDFIYRFPNYRFRASDGLCRVRTFVGKDQEVIAVLTDLDLHNPSSPVDISFESIRASLILKGLLPPESRFVLHEEPSRLSGARFWYPLSSPPWEKALSRGELCRILGCPSSEFDLLTADIPAMANEMMRLRCQIDPYLDHPCPEYHEVTRRRLDIEDHMLEKSQIATLVESGAGERELSHALQLDLSLLAETYAYPEGEYICFSEFPVGDRIADFAVFTSRSRMLVTLIEIKGADFLLTKSNHYGSFHSKIEEAALQLRSHERYIANHYDQTRLLFHQIRKRVEQGETLYRSLLCPRGRLEVDPEKDIDLYKVILAGRTRNDLDDSRKRFDYENVQGIHIESWDTWLKKLRRR